MVGASSWCERIPVRAVHTSHAHARRNLCQSLKLCQRWLFFRRAELAYDLLLPPATKLQQGNVFTPVCDSVHWSGGRGGCSLSRGVSVWGRPQGDPPYRDTVTCGWFASYWNAFLLIFFGQFTTKNHHFYLKKVCNSLFANANMLVTHCFLCVTHTMRVQLTEMSESVRRRNAKRKTLKTSLFKHNYRHNYQCKYEKRDWCERVTKMNFFTFKTFWFTSCILNGKSYVKFSNDGYCTKRMPFTETALPY